MKFQMIHENYNVADLSRSLTFYQEALGLTEFHLAFQADNYEEAHALHEKMGCICFENHDMGIYFISDPDGYWLEVVPAK